MAFLSPSRSPRTDAARSPQPRSCIIRDAAAGASISAATRRCPRIGQQRRISTCSRSTRRSLRSMTPDNRGMTHRRAKPAVAVTPVAAPPSQMQSAVARSTTATRTAAAVFRGIRPRSIRFFHRMAVSGRPAAARRNGSRPRPRREGTRQRPRRRPRRASSRRALSTVASSKRMRERTAHSTCAATATRRMASPPRRGPLMRPMSGSEIHRNGASSSWSGPLCAASVTVRAEPRGGRCSGSPGARRAQRPARSVATTGGSPPTRRSRGRRRNRRAGEPPPRASLSAGP